MISVGRFCVRPVEKRDLDRVVELDRLFGNVALDKEYFESWMAHHPEGFLVAEFDERIYAYSMGIYLHEYQIRDNWLHDTGEGTCRTHSPLGEYFYAVSIASQKPDAARALFIVNRRLFARSHMHTALIYGRLPLFRRWVESHGYDPDSLSYEQKKRLLALYVANMHDAYQVFYEGLNLTPETGIVDYLKGDEPSLNCAVKMVWRNPYYRPVHLDRAVVAPASPSIWVPDSLSSARQ